MEKVSKITIISTESLALNGPRMLSSYLKKHGFFVQLISLATFNDNFPANILDRITKLSEGSLLLCFSCMSVTSRKLSQVIRHLRPLGIPMVWGGIHATLNPEECLKHVDVVCRGEGEEALLELVQALKNEEKITKIKNLWVKQDGKVYRNDVRHLISDIDKLPFPDYNFESQYVLVDGRLEPFHERHLSYGEHNLSNILLAVMKCFITAHTIRGCPYNCKYCSNHELKEIYKNKGVFVRRRSAKSVAHEISHLKQKFPSLQFVWFTDDDFFARSSKELSSFSRIYREKARLPFMCYVTPPTFSEEKLKLLLQAGLYIIEVGVQTGDQEFNQQVYNRNYKDGLVLNIGKISRKYTPPMFPPVYQIMYMNPLEKESNILHTIKLLRSLPRPFFLKPFNIVFFPGSAMHRQAESILSKRLDFKDSYLTDYLDTFSHIPLKEDNSLYLNVILHYMARRNTKYRSGIIPNFMLGLLLSKPAVKLSKNLDFIPKLLLFIPTLNNLFWLTPKRYKGKCLRTVVALKKAEWALKRAFFKAH